MLTTVLIKYSYTFLDDKEVSRNNYSESFLSYSKIANFEDHDKLIACQVDHQLLSLPLHEKRKLVVKCKYCGFIYNINILIIIINFSP